MALLLGLRLAAARVAVPSGTLTFAEPESPVVGVPIDLDVEVSGDITRVDYWIGSECVAIVREAPYTYTWTPDDTGSVVVSVYGRTTGGALVDLATQSVTVAAEGGATGSCTITDPGTVYEGVATDGVTVVPSGDTDRVVLTCGGADPVELTGPWVAAWTPASGEGGTTVTITAVCYAGATVVDTVTREVAVGAAPTIEITCADPLYIEDTSTTLSAEASDPIDSVQFGYDIGAGEVAIGTDDEEPYTIPWPINQTPGTATLFAHGYYGAVELVSDSVAVTVRSRKADLLAAHAVILTGAVVWDPRYGLSLRDGTGADEGKQFVQSWTDLSGTYQIVNVTESQQPEYRATGWNGMPAVYADGARSTRLVCTDAALLAPFQGDDADTVLACANDSNELGKTLLCLGGVDAPAGAHLYLKTATGVLSYYRNAASVSASTAGSGRRHSLARNVGTAGAVFRNGASVGTATMNDASKTFTKFVVGCYSSGATQWFVTGNFGPIVLAQTCPDPSALAALWAAEGYTYA